MERISLSKSVRSFGLMAILSVTIATSLQQPIQAQSKGNKVPTTTDGTCAPLPQGVVYQEFRGITLSQKQKNAYRKLEAKIQKRFNVINGNAKQVVPSGAPVNIDFKPGTSDEKATEIADASLKMVQDKLSTAQQLELLTKKYGRYAKFYLAKSTIYTPEQIANGQQFGLDLEAQTKAILTPDQQKIYEANLAIQRKLQACVEPSPFARIISPRPY
jgi:hypothetical protein